MQQWWGEGRKAQRAFLCGLSWGKIKDGVPGTVSVQFWQVRKKKLLKSYLLSKANSFQT